MKSFVFCFLCFVVALLTAVLRFDTNAAMGKVCSSCREELGSANNKQPTFQKALGATRKVSVGAAGLLNWATLSETVRGKYKYNHKYEYKYIIKVESTAICSVTVFSY